VMLFIVGTISESSGLSEGLKIIATALVTVSVFVIGQLIQRLFIEPIQRQRQMIGKVAHALTFYRGIAIDAQGEKPTRAQIDGVRKALRGLAANLRATLSSIPWYGFFEFLHLALPRDTIKHVGYQLMRWQLFMSEKAVAGAIAEVSSRLGLDYIEDEWVEFHRMLGLPPSK
jgi:hypothetical protein